MIRTDSKDEGQEEPCDMLTGLEVEVSVIVEVVVRTLVLAKQQSVSLSTLWYTSSTHSG